MKKIFLIMIALLIIIGSTYQIRKVNTVTEEIDDVDYESFVLKNQRIDKNEAVVYEDEYADDAFKSVYELSNLINHEVYRHNDTIYIDLFFDENVSRSEISNSRIYVMKLFVLKSEMKITRIPYVLETLLNDMSWKNVRLNIFVNDTIILQEKFANIDDRLKGDLIIDYYENSAIEIPSRIIANNNFDDFLKSIKFRFWGLDSISFEKSFKENFIFLKIKDEKQYSSEKIMKMKEIVESKIIEDLMRDFEEKPEGFDKSGIVFQMYDDNQKYYEMTYIFDDKKGWVADYWFTVN